LIRHALLSGPLGPHRTANAGIDPRQPNACEFSCFLFGETISPKGNAFYRKAGMKSNQIGEQMSALKPQT
jgi:hypothetical protein